MEARARRVLRELAKRSRRDVDLVDPDFPKQTSLIEDGCRLKAALTTRRSGKSFGAGIYLLQEALRYPGSSCLYVALTRESAKRIMFKDVFKVLNRRHKLGARFNEVTLTVTLPNGSVIYLLGMDSKPEEADKALGQKFRLAVVDECASFRQDLRHIVYRVLKPTMTDLNGTILLIGTPSNLTRSLFFDITTGKEPGWSVHKWSALDNPYIREKFQLEMDELATANPAIVDTPLWKQMYLGLWDIDVSKRCYRYGDHNVIESLPEGRYTNVLGVDLGFTDPSAFTVVGYTDTDPTTYVRLSEKKSGMDITDVANRIKELIAAYDISKVVVDGAHRQAVEEMRRRHDLPMLEIAEKQGKAETIEIMNAELTCGKVKLVADETVDLRDEWDTLVWDERSATRKENPTCPNHCADSALYAWRACYSYLARVAHPTKPVSAEQQVEAFWDRESQALDRQRAKPWWERDFE